MYAFKSDTFAIRQAAFDAGADGVLEVAAFHSGFDAAEEGGTRICPAEWNHHSELWLAGFDYYGE